jgi:hypothetical protein
MDYQSEWDARVKHENEMEAARELAAMSMLAQALSEESSESIEEIEKRCRQRAADWLAQIAHAVKDEGAEAKKGLVDAKCEVSVKWSHHTPGLIVGEARVNAPHAVHIHEFECVAKDAENEAGRSALRALMSANYWIAEGFEMAEVADQEPESLEVCKMLLMLSGSCAAGAVLVKMVETETAWNSERWRAGLWLEKMVNQAASRGLIPSGFSSSRIRLFGGWPGEATEVVGWEARHAGFGSRGPDGLESLREKRPGEDSVTWELPSLDAGPMELWRAFCHKVASCQTRGWPSMPSHYAAHIKSGAALAAIESQLLGASASLQEREEPIAKKPRAL